MKESKSLFNIPELDIKGQKLCENIMFYGIVLGYCISLGLGFYLKNLYYTLVFAVLTVILVGILTIPPYKCYRKNPISFLKKKKD